MQFSYAAQRWSAPTLESRTYFSSWRETLLIAPGAALWFLGGPHLVDPRVAVVIAKDQRSVAIHPRSSEKYRVLSRQFERLLGKDTLGEGD